MNLWPKLCAPIPRRRCFRGGHAFLEDTKRVLWLTLLITASNCLGAGKEPPRIPTHGEVSQYERERPVFKGSAIRREWGEAILKLLAGGEALREPVLAEAELEARRLGLRTNGTIAEFFKSPEYLAVSLILTNASKYRLGISRDGRTLWLPDGPVAPPAQLAYRIRMVLDEVVADLKTEILAARRPLVYEVGALDDGGTLSGVARLFYGNASKWRQIYEANRARLKNPDVLKEGVELVIPALK